MILVLLKFVRVIIWCVGGSLYSLYALLWGLGLSIKDNGNPSYQDLSITICFLALSFLSFLYIVIKSDSKLEEWITRRKRFKPCWQEPREYV